MFVWQQIIIYTLILTGMVAVILWNQDDDFRRRRSAKVRVRSDNSKSSHIPYQEELSEFEEINPLNWLFILLAGLALFSLIGALYSLSI